MKKTIYLIVILSTILSASALANLSDEEKLTSDFQSLLEDGRTGIWQDQWTYYRAGAEQYIYDNIDSRYGSAYESFEITSSDQWTTFRDAYKWDHPANILYWEYVNMQVDLAITASNNNIPIDGGLGILLLSGLGFGSWFIKKKV